MKEPIASLGKDLPKITEEQMYLGHHVDFVILELQEPFDSTLSVAPACLPTTVRTY